MLKIAFMTTLGVNVGDEFIREGIRSILDECGEGYVPLYVNKHDPKSLHESHEDESVICQDKYWDSDLFIQAGAPVYWHLHNGESTSLTSEWHQWLWVERILSKEKRRHPVFMNLGAGSTFPFGESGANFVADSSCRQFASDIAQRAVLTTVRDRVASDILDEIGVKHHLLACPAFLAARRHSMPRHRSGLIGVNLMRLAGHGFGRGDFDADLWKNKAMDLCRGLRLLGRLVFICHDTIEVDYAAGFAEPSERIFFAPTWRPYLDIYSACEMVVANRVHGAVLAAGFGVPGIIIGSDTRALIGEPIGLTIFDEKNIVSSDVIQQAQKILGGRSYFYQTLLKKRESVAKMYRELLTSALPQ